MPQSLPEWRLKSETPANGELVTVPRPGLEGLEPNMDYHADNLETIRFKFLGSMRNPKVSLAGGPPEIKKLTYVFQQFGWEARGVQDPSHLQGQRCNSETVLGATR